MTSLLKQKIYEFPELKNSSPQTLNTIQLLLTQFQKTTLSQQENQIQYVERYQMQFRNLFRAFDNSSKIALLKDENHRALVIAFIEMEGVQYYKYSYFNRAKLTKAHINRMKEVGPILFSEAVMIASKINLINKNNSRLFIQDHLYTESQSPIDMKIQQILKLCDEKKRNINNNLKKLQLILEGPEYLEVVKQLGKMLRDSWKKDKSKMKIQDIVKNPMKMSFNENLVKQMPIKQANSQQQNQNDNQSCHTQKVPKSDILSFTSSQKQIIIQAQEKAKKYQFLGFNMSEYDELDSLFHVKSFFSDRNQSNFPCQSI